ncbi:MAG: hypothetical protein ACYCZF_13310 [Anaerolineae bacterium]
MKNAYYGDVNDYLKYGLLRCLANEGSLSIGVFWMLTEGGSGNDGKFTRYLDKPKKWKSFDELLFNRLYDDVRVKNHRSVSQVKSGGLIPNGSFYDTVVPAETEQRNIYFTQGLNTLSKSDVIFFDPDNGTEVPSVRYGTAASIRYIYWSELATAYKAGHSLLVYQHYPREKRNKFHQRISDDAQNRLSPGAIYVLNTAHMAYFLFARPEHRSQVDRAISLVKSQWKQEITPEKIALA